MTLRKLFGSLLVVVLLLLLAVPVAAQDSLTQTFTWEPYSLSFGYPADWIVASSDELVSVHPADRDISAGTGPELILFAVPGAGEAQIDSTINTYVGQVTGTVGIIESEFLENRPTRSFTFDQTSPDTVGSMMVLAVDANTLIGVGYTVSDSEMTVYLPSLKAIKASLTFDASSRPVDAQTYQNAALGYTLAYPDTWTITENENRVLLHPQNVTVDESSGPEFLIVKLTDPAASDLDQMLQLAIDSQPGASFDAAASATVDGHATRFVTYTHTGRIPVVRGAVYLIHLGGESLLAVGYRSADDEFATYQPVFESIRQSMHFPAVMSDTLVSAGTTTSIASVQLPQRYIWDSVGLALYLPAGWTIAPESGDILTAAPPLEAVESASLMYARIMESSPNTDLRTAAQLMLEAGDQVSEFVDVTIAGYPGLTYEFSNTSDGVTLRFRAVMVNVEDRNAVVLIMFGTEDSYWETFRPTVEAMIASIEPNTSAVSAVPDRNHPIRAHAYLVPRSWMRQDDTEPDGPFNWEEYGITLDLPEGWQPITNNQDYDLILASPAAMQGGSGSFITFRHIPTIGTDTPESILTTLLDQVPEGEEVEAYTLGGSEGSAIIFTDEATSTTQYLILIPYGTSGELFYVQSNAAADDGAVIESTLDSVVIDPLQPDYAAIDAAWQTSLEAQGKLIYGDDDAPLHMVEILDFSCSHCAEYSQDINRLIPLEVEPGRLQLEFVLVDLIGGELSNVAAQAAYCATEQGKGYTVYKALFKGYIEQGHEVAYSRGGIDDLLGDLVDLEALNTCLDEGRYSENLTEAQAYWDEVGATGTPSILLAEGDAEPAFMTLPNGELWSGGIPVSSLRMIIGRVVDEGVELSNIFAAEATEESPQ